MNLLTISDLSPENIDTIFTLSRNMESEEIPQPLKGKTILLFFPESSIRTRITFEMAVKQLGGELILFPPSSLDKRESLEDVAAYVENWVDAIIVRHPDITAIQTLAENCGIPVINAMTKENHPCEILSDLFSLSELRPEYINLKYLFVGEDGNIYNSWKNAAEVLKFNLTQINPPGDLEAALPSADIILCDSLPEGLRNDEYISSYQITTDRMDMARPDALLNPCPPFFRGEEVSKAVLDSPYFVGYGFKKNLLRVQKSIILFCMNLKR
jgi:ornithine carbamoyltransferase